jgi:hypothetical protein
VLRALDRARKLARGVRKRAIELPLNIDPARALQAVQRLKRLHPGETTEQLARRIAQRRMWTPAAIGFVTGAPSSPWTAPWLAAADVGLAVRHHVETACQVAALYDPAFFDRDDAHWEVLVPVLGASEEGRMLDSARQQGSGIGEAVRGRVLQRVQLLAFRRLAAMVVKKAVLAKALPVVGGVIGGVWGLSDSWTVSDRIVAYFARGDGPERDPAGILR